MRSCFVLLFASLLTSCEAQGTIETSVFVLKGRDLLLELHDDPPEGVSYVEWKINKTVKLVRFDPSGKSTVSGRLELGGKNFSVILKNLQEADSGVYSAVAVTDTVDKLVAEYKVTVQGPASPVELTVDRVDSRSSESCDLHVTCRTHNSQISSTFKCPKGVCSQEGGERSEVTTSGASLQVYPLDTVIICDHSNQAHWTQDLIHAEHLCSPKPDLRSYLNWVTAICILTVIIIVVLFFWLYRQRRIISYGRRFVYLVREALQNKNVTNISEECCPCWPKTKGKTSASPQKRSPAEHAADLGRRFVDLVCSVLQNKNVTNISEEHGTHQSNIKGITSAPPPMLSPEDPDSDLGRRFKNLVNDALPKLTSKPHQDESPADDPGLGRGSEDLVLTPLQRPRPAPPQNWRPVKTSDLQAILNPRLSSPIPQDENSTSAPLLNESRADPNPGLGGRFVDLVNSGLLISAPHQKLSTPVYAEDVGKGSEDLVHAHLLDKIITNSSEDPGTRGYNTQESRSADPDPGQDLHQQLGGSWDPRAQH